MTLGEVDWMPGFSLHQKQLIADVLCEVPQLPYPQTPALPEVMPHPSRANSAQESEQQVSADNARCSVTEPSLPMSQPGRAAVQSDCELFQRNNLFQSDAGMNMLKDCPWPLRDGNQSTGYLQSTLQSPFDGISGGFLPFSEASSDSSPWTPNKPWGPSYQGAAATQGELDTVYGRVQVETTDQHNGGSRDLVADIQAGTALVSSLSRWQQMPDTYTEDPQ
jgi:hypothetical protein